MYNNNQFEDNMNELPPNIETYGNNHGYNQEIYDDNINNPQFCFGSNNGNNNNNVCNENGNELINHMMDEVVYDENNINVNGNYCDYNHSVHRGDYHQNNYNHQFSKNYEHEYIHSNDANMLCVNDRIQCLSSIQQTSNIAISIQPPYIPQFPNNADLVKYCPIMNQQKAVNQQKIDYQQHPEQLSSSYSDNSSLYGPNRGATNYNVSQRRYSPISTPKPPNTSTMISNYNNSINTNYNNNTRMIDSYQITPFSSSQSNQFPYNEYQQQNYNNGQTQTGFGVINNMENTVNFRANNNDNTDNFLLSNISPAPLPNYSSPTPLFGGFL